MSTPPAPKKRVVIFGAGPAGLAACQLFASEGKGRKWRVEVYDAQPGPGGTWRTSAVSPGGRGRGGEKADPGDPGEQVGVLWSHHSPQVFFSAYVHSIELMRRLGVDWRRNLVPVGQFWRANLARLTTWRDRVVLAWLYLETVFDPETASRTTVAQRLAQTRHELSPGGHRFVRAACLMVDGANPERMTLAELFLALDQTSLSTAYVPDFVGNVGPWASAVLSLPNVSYFPNHSLKDLAVNGEGSLAVNVRAAAAPKREQQEKTKNRTKAKKVRLTVEAGDLLVLALDPVNLHDFFENCSDAKVRNNWGNWREEVRQKLRASAYCATSVQLHFPEGHELSNDVLPESLKMGLGTRWNILCLFLPNERTLSCAVLGFEDCFFPSGEEGEGERNRRRGNAAEYEREFRQMSLAQVEREVLAQVWAALAKERPRIFTRELLAGVFTTAAPDLRWDTAARKIRHTLSGAARTPLGTLGPWGRDLDNVALVGAMNPRSFAINTFESSVESSVRMYNSLRARSGGQAALTSVRPARTLSQVALSGLAVVVVTGLALFTASSSAALSRTHNKQSLEKALLIASAVISGLLTALALAAFFSMTLS